MIVACHAILDLSRRGCHWLFDMTAFVIQTTVLKAMQSMPTYFQGMLSDFPRDIRTVIKEFRLDAAETILAICPKCHTAYHPTNKRPAYTYQKVCNSRRYGSLCKELLLRPKQGSQVGVPIKPYVVFSFKDWVAGLLSRPGYEEMMDKAWDRMTPSPSESLDDIFQGANIRQFKGPDGEAHFMFAGGESSDAGRYLFSLSLDFFNPLRNIAGGKTVSVGVISLACLNLPIGLRFKPENMFLLGIIPGPKEPSLDAINPYLRPLVNELLELWTGVRFTRTSRYPLGRLIFCAVVCVVCDIPAARKIAGFASHRHDYFCPFCWCDKTQYTYNNIEVETWVERTSEEWRAWAEQFREATTAKAANSSFDRSGCRWSELLRLPYFVPTSFLVVDPMHNLYLGLVKEHFQKILGYRQKGKPSSIAPGSINIDIPVRPGNPMPQGKRQKEGIRKVVRILQSPLDFEDREAISDATEALLKPQVAALIYVALSLGCLPNATKTVTRGKRTYTVKLKKEDIVPALLAWVGCPA